MFRTPTMVAPWPWTKFERNLEAADLGKRKPAVVVASGAFSLCHVGHVQMLHKAKERLERAGYAVLAGWLSPWGDGAALEKASWYNQEKLSATLRMRVARISVQDDPFVSVGSFETDEGIDGDALHHYVGPGLLEELKERYQDELGGHEMKVFLVCGSDEIEEQMSKGHYAHRVVVPRSAENSLIEKPNTGLLVAEPVPGKGAYLAATQVRKALRTREMAFLGWAMHPAAVKFLYGGKTGDMEIDADLADFLGPEPQAAGWPTDRLAQRLAAAPENRKLLVLVTSGAMSPATRGHLQTMHAARERMERAGYVVIGAYLLPTNEEAADGLPELSRAFCDAVTELAVCDDQLVAAASLEAVGLGGRPRGEVRPRHLVHALRDELLRRFQLSLENRTLHAFYVVGEDSVQPNAKLFFSSPEVGVVTVPTESDDSQSVMLEEARRNIYVADEQPANGSAALRALIKAGDTERAAAAMTPAVARFVLSPTTSELEKFSADFEKLGVRPAQDDELQSVRESLKRMLRSFTGPAGTIEVKDLERLIKMLDPSWTDKELEALIKSADKVQNGAAVVSDDFIDWIFGAH